jgi:CelD/BcsL family acetyltransferase involved in cellulose biosynthesis
MMTRSQAVRMSVEYDAPTPEEWAAFRESIDPDMAILSPALSRIWSEIYLPFGRWRGPCRHLTVRDASKNVVAVFSYARMYYGPFHVVAAAGPYHPYRAFPAARASNVLVEACDALAAHLTAAKLPQIGLRIGPTLQGNPVVTEFMRALASYGWQVGTAVRGGNYTIELPSTVEEWRSKLGGVLQKVQYYQRRLSRDGEVKARRYGSGDDVDWHAVVAELARIEANSWVAKQGETKVSSPADQEFWRRVLSEQSIRGLSAIWILYHRDQPIAFSLQFKAAGINHTLANSFDENFKLHSPGHILASYVIKDSIERKFRMIEWGMGDSGYKARWMAEETRTLIDTIAFPPGLAGRLMAGIAHRRLGFSFAGAA